LAAFHEWKGLSLVFFGDCICLQYNFFMKEAVPWNEFVTEFWAFCNPGQRKPPNVALQAVDIRFRYLKDLILGTFVFSQTLRIFPHFSVLFKIFKPTNSDLRIQMR
jgi:hypothetical protein